MEEKDLISPPKMKKGLIVVGSYVKMTTMQLLKLLEETNIERIEIKISEVINNYRSYLRDLSREVDKLLSEEKSTVIYTEREYFRDEAKRDLKIGQKISNFLGDLIKNIDEKPEFIISKGGITSHVLAERGLNAKKVKVLGQTFPGIPIWELGEESKYPGLLYVVFPGNVGNENTLLEVYKKFVYE